MTSPTNGTGSSRIDGSPTTRATPPSARVASDTPSRGVPSLVARTRDVLDLSPAARAIVAGAEDEAPLPAERLLEIRQRILEGAYDASAVLDRVAARIRDDLAR